MQLVQLMQKEHSAEDGVEDAEVIEEDISND
jgi:hypothetical protein